MIPDQGIFTTPAYHKTTNFTHLDSFFPSNCKVGMAHTFLHRWSQVWSNWTKFHLKLVWLMNIFKKNGYPDNLTNNCFKRFLDNKHRIEEKIITVPKRPFLDHHCYK